MSTKTTRASKKTVEVKVEAPVEPKVVVEEPTVVEQPEAIETTVEDSMKQRFENMIKSKQDQITDLKREIQDLRKMQKDHEIILRDALKKSKKKRTQKDDGTVRKPSGFASPVVVSNELYDFLGQFGVKKGDPIARTDVTRHITTYIKEKDLQNPEHRREIVPDATLKKLFGAPMEPKDPNDPTSPKIYTYLKLQRYLSPHFPKKQ